MLCIGYAKSVPVEGFCSGRETVTPHPSAMLRIAATLSHKGRREERSRHVLIENLHGIFEIDRDQLRDAAFGHGDAEQPVHPRHRDRIMRNDDEAGFG
jgi:hypothetical protein